MMCTFLIEKAYVNIWQKNNVGYLRLFFGISNKQNLFCQKLILSIKSFACENYWEY